MVDQASDLRKLINTPPPVTENVKNKDRPIKKARVFSITSGKGGVGKTSIAVNLAYALEQQNKRTLIIDADLGLAGRSRAGALAGAGVPCEPLRRRGAAGAGRRDEPAPLQGVDVAESEPIRGRVASPPSP